MRDPSPERGGLVGLSPFSGTDHKNCRQLPCPPFAPVAYATLQMAVFGMSPLTIYVKRLAKKREMY